MDSSSGFYSSDTSDTNDDSRTSVQACMINTCTANIIQPGAMKRIHVDDPNDNESLQLVYIPHDVLQDRCDRGLSMGDGAIGARSKQLLRGRQSPALVQAKARVKAKLPC